MSISLRLRSTVPRLYSSNLLQGMWYQSMDNPAEDLEEIRQRLEGLRSLLKYPPWVHQVSLVEAQCVARETPFKKQPISSIDEALKQNYQKGIVEGMRLAIALPGKLEELAREAFNLKLEEERNNGD